MAFAMFVGLCVSIVGAILFAIILGKRTSSPTVHFIANRTLSLFQIGSLFISTSMALAGAIFSAIWLGYSVGLSSLILQCLWFFGFMMASQFSRKIATLSQNGTLHGNIGVCFGRDTAVLAAAATILGFTLLIGWEAVVAADMFIVVSADSEFLFLIMLSLACCASAYTAVGGIAGNVAANRFQNTLAYVAVVYLLVRLVFWDLEGGAVATKNLVSVSSWSPFGGGLLSLPLGAIVSTILTSLTWQLVDASAWQNIASHREGEGGVAPTIRIAGVVVFFAGGFLPTLIGYYLSATPNLTADNIVGHILTLLRDDAIGLAVVVAGFTGAMLSTADSFVLACSETICWDLLGDGKGKLGKVAAMPESELTETFEFEVDSDGVVSGSLNSHEGQHTMADGAELADRRDFRLSKLLGIACAVLGGSLVYFLRVSRVDLYNVVWIVYLSQCTLVPVVLAVLCASGQRGVELPGGVCSIAVGFTFGSVFGTWSIFTEPDLLSWTPVVTCVSAAGALLGSKKVLRP